ncbi:MAG TPA: 50S ribosomal protein L25 [Trueperaceae bacterium]
MKLEAQRRTAKAATLRQQGHIPAMVYNKTINIPVSVELRAFDKAFRSQGTSSIIDLDIEGDNHEVLVKEVQMDKRRRLPLHVDFYAVTAGQAVQVHVPLEYTGKAIGTREGGLLDVHRRELYISVIPRLIPNHLEVDVSALGIGDSIHIRDIAGLLPAEAEILDDQDLTLVTVAAPRVAEEVEEAAEAAEPEVIGRGEEEEAEDEA